MSSRRGGHRRGKNTPSHHQHDQTDEKWSLKPIINHDIQTHETSSSASTLHPIDQKRPQGRRGSRWAPRNRGAEPQFVKNSEKGKEEEEGSNGGSVSRLNIDSNCGHINEEDENCVSGLVSELNLSPNSGESKLIDAESGKRVEITAGPSNSSDQIGEDDDDAVQRLEELRLSVEETELSEELMSINNQLQEDELLVMESIYGDNNFILDSKSGLKCFQTHIHIEVPNGISITAKLNSANLDEDSTDFSYSFRVEYIPPIILTCLLPKSYPSNDAPYFSISAQWLSSAKISDLCCKLDSIWKEQSGQEVIYQWVEWLHSCALSYLGFDDEIVLGPYGVTRDKDMRAISKSVSPDIDIPLLKSYNDEQRHENFCRNIQQCCICFNEFAGSEFIKLPCQHFFCWKCMKTFSDMHIAEGTVMKLQCPESKCDGMIPPGLLKRLLGEKEFEQWESLTLQKTLESMSDVVYCPRCETVCLEDESNHAQCSKCYYSFCTLCMDRRHVGIQCMTPETKLLILKRLTNTSKASSKVRRPGLTPRFEDLVYSKVRQPGLTPMSEDLVYSKDRQNSNVIRDDQRRREADMINQILSLKEINRFAKQCPSCKMAISRTEGCNKIFCKNCGAYFCYLCNQAISGYEHFRDGNCVLFPTEEIQRWEEMNGRQVAGQIQAEMFADHGHPCPSCGQPNVKVGNNNHIFCWACQNHYCYLCRKMVKKSSQHFGPKGCKQHTAG